MRRQERPPRHNQMDSMHVPMPNLQHKNTALNGYYTAELRDQMPPIFTQKFRARQMLDYLAPSQLKNYSSKGYKCMIDSSTDIFSRFEGEEQELQAREEQSKKESRA